jgi:carbon storage regulator CsrA
MLILSRGCDTSIHIGPNITVKVLAIQKQRVKLGVDAPSHFRVLREEVASECLEAGANAFVPKAQHFDDLRRSVARTAAFWTSECRVPCPRVPQAAGGGSRG